MAYAYAQYTGTGSATNYTFPFPYIAPSHIKVRLNGALTTAFTFLNTSTIKLTTAPASGVVVDIRRESPKDSPVVNFTDGSVLLEADLDLLATYSLYLAQENQDNADSTIQLSPLGTFNVLGYRISSLGAPVLPQDAVTKNYVDVLAPGYAAAVISTSASAAIATSKASEATSAAAVAVAISTSSPVATVGADLSGQGYPSDLGSITEVAAPVNTVGTSNIATVAANIVAVNTVATNAVSVSVVAANMPAVNAAVASAASASSSASNAAASESNALSSKNAAASSATTAGGSASAASGSASAANTSAASASASLVSFRRQYQGALPADPTVRFDSTALVGGDLYFNTGAAILRYYTSGTNWVDVVPGNILDGSVTSAKLAPTLDMGTVP